MTHHMHTSGTQHCLLSPIRACPWGRSYIQRSIFQGGENVKQHCSKTLLNQEPLHIYMNRALQIRGWPPGWTDWGPACPCPPSGSHGELSGRAYCCLALPGFSKPWNLVHIFTSLLGWLPWAVDKYSTTTFLKSVLKHTWMEENAAVLCGGHMWAYKSRCMCVFAWVVLSAYHL